jgi:hypothetical protein
MPRRFHTNLYDEYNFLFKKMLRLKVKWEESQGLLVQTRLMKKARSYARRLLELEKLADEMGIAHPMAVLEKAFDSKTSKLINKTVGTASPSSMLNPDGTLFQTPKLAGSFLDRKTINPGE